MDESGDDPKADVAVPRGNIARRMDHLYDDTTTDGPVADDAYVHRSVERRQLSRWAKHIPFLEDGIWDPII